MKEKPSLLESGDKIDYRLEVSFLNRLASIVDVVDNFDKKLEDCSKGSVNTQAECMVDAICAIDYTFQNLDRMNLLEDHRKTLNKLASKYLEKIRKFSEKRKCIEIKESGEMESGIAKKRKIVDKEKYRKLESELKVLLEKLKEDILRVVSEKK